MEKFIVIGSVVLFIVTVVLLMAWLISWCITPFLLTFGLPTVTPLAVLGFMVSCGLFKGFLNLFEMKSNK